jgi:O-Antigen ligase
MAMEVIAQMPFATWLRSAAARIDTQVVAVWLLGFALVVYLAMNGGGYEPVVRDQLGIAVWWGVLLGFLVGALPLNRLRHGSMLAFGFLFAYVAWVTISLIWTETTAATLEDVGRVITYLGVFTLALSIRSSKGARRMASALAAGIAVVALIALLSRLHPAWFPNADQTVAFLATNRNRLAYPLGYWNGNASLVAIGLPLVLYVACSARRVFFQALAAAALPAMGLTLYFTFSRGGTLAAIAALIVFIGLAHDRVPKAGTLVLAALGTAILIAGAHQRDALDAGLAGPLAEHQGNQMLAMTIVVCVGVGLLQAAIATALRHGRRPAWMHVSSRTSSVAVAVIVATVVVAGVAAGVSGKASDAWHEFTQAKSVSHGAERFSSFSSTSRWPLWEATLHEDASAPLIGTGSGSFEGWWAQHGDDEGFVKDAHSLYFETLGELGIIGLALIVGLLATVLFVGARRYLEAARARRTQLAAVLAGCVAFCLAAGYDWLWELAVVPVAFLLLASTLVSAGERPRKKPVPIPLRLGGTVLAIAAMVAIAIPLSAVSSLQQSQAAARGANPGAALEHARNARNVEPYAAEPRIQEAVLLEAQNRLDAAAAAIEGATRVEPSDWRAWLVRSRIEAERGSARASLHAYQRARALNPRSSLFR